MIFCNLAVSKQKLRPSERQEQRIPNLRKALDVGSNNYSMRYSFLVGLSWTLVASCNNVGTVSTDTNNPLMLESSLSTLFTSGQHSATLTYNKELKDTNREGGAITITKAAHQISFTGVAALSIVDSLIINTNDSSAIFKQSRLTHFDCDNSSRKNEFIPNDEYLDPCLIFKGPIGVEGLLPTSSAYTLVIGRLKKSGKTCLYLKTHEPLDPTYPFDHFYSIIFD
jgi:hypothetical protein